MTNGSTITQRIGLEQFARVRNLQGDTIEVGDVVYISGASGDRASVKLADNRADSTSSKTLGVATEQILPNDVGLIGTFGVVGKLNLSAFTAGDVVYLDSIPGKLTKVKPQAPYHMVFVGIVERANAGNGLLFVNVQNGYELEELHNVRITSPVNNRAILAYDSVARLWKDTTLNGIGGVTGSGTANYVTKWTGTNTTGNSSIQDDGTNVSVNANFILNGLLDEPIVSFRSSTGATTYGNIKGTSTGLEFIANGSRNLIFTSNGSERMRVTSGGDVGIGTSSPAYKLDVNGSGRFSSDIVVNSVNVGKGAGSGINNVAIGSNPLSSNTTGSYNIAIGIDALAGVTSGARNIGIGENAGKYLVSSAHNIVIGNSELNGLTTGSFNTIIGSQINSLSNISNHIILADGSGNQRIVVDAAGDVGIGTSTPDSALTVVNGALFQRGVRMSGLPTAAGTRALRVDANGTLSVSDTLANGISGSGTTNYIPKFTSSSAIGNSIVFDNGTNVGIGTTSPSAKLEVNGNVTSSGNYVSSNASASYIASLGTADNQQIRMRMSGTNGILDVTRNSGTSPNLIFGTEGTERMRLDASGNLGLGVTPSAWSGLWSAEQIGQAGALFAYKSGSNYTVLTNNSYTIGGAYQTGDARYINTGFSTAYIQNNSGQHLWMTAPSGTAGGIISFTQAMTLDASGNLGVGTSVNTGSRINAYISEAGATPNAILRLQNSGNSYLARMILTDGVTNDGVIGYQGGSTSATQYLGFGLGVNPTQMILTAAGNVGIGTTSPAVRLDVLESGSLGTASSGTIARFTSTGASGFDALIGIVGGNAGRSILDLGDSDAAAVGRLGYDHTSNFMFFNTNSAERMRITSGGEVYIAGTTDQGAYNLQVNGTGVWGAGAYVDGSDSAVKKNIQPLGSALDLIKQMNPVTFEYQPFYSKDTTTQTGFIAQELQQVLSDKVYKNGIVKEGGQYLGVAYQHLIPLLVKSIQELEAQVQALKSQLNK
jgi:hypothetical protein